MSLSQYGLSGATRGGGQERLVHSFIVILFPQLVKNKCEKRKYQKRVRCSVQRGCHQHLSLLQYQKNATIKNVNSNKSSMAALPDQKKKK